MQRSLTPKDWLTQQHDKLVNADSSALISSNYAALLNRYLLDKGVATNALLAEANITQEELAEASGHIRYQQYAPLVLGAIEATGNKHLGLAFGERLNISTHGFLGYAVMSCPSFEKIADLLGKYIKIRNQLLVISHSFVENGIMIKFATNAPDTALDQFEIESSLASTIHIWAELFGNAEGLHAIHISEKFTRFAGIYREYFDIPILENQPHNAIVIQADETTLLSRITDKTLSRIAEQQCIGLLNKLREQQTDALVHKVRQHLLKAPGQFASQNEVAEKLGMSTRTLNRQLARQGNAFQAIVDQLRQEIAIQCLEQTEWPVDEIAAILGYSDGANFNRAFKRWQGVTPRKYRADHHK